MDLLKFKNGYLAAIAAPDAFIDFVIRAAPDLVESFAGPDMAELVQFVKNDVRIKGTNGHNYSFIDAIKLHRKLFNSETKAAKEVCEELYKEQGVLLGSYRQI